MGIERIHIHDNSACRKDCIVGNNILRAVGQGDAHPVTFPDPEMDQSVCQAQHLGAHLNICQFSAVKIHSCPVRSLRSGQMNKVLNRKFRVVD